MSLIERIKSIESSLSAKKIKIHVLTIMDCDNETYEQAIKRYEQENNCKVNSGDSVIKIHVKSDQQIREQKIK